MNMMRLLKELIRLADTPVMDMLLMWSVSTLAFHGAFRIHELLSKADDNFDPDFTLLTKTVVLKLSKSADEHGFLEITLKCPKESKTGKAVVIEVFQTNGVLCPVKAYSRWCSRAQSEPNLPLFCEESGLAFTGSKFSKWLRDTLAGHVDYECGKFTSHSFRIGLATTLASLGFLVDDIKEAGRWSSNAWELYAQLPRVKRAAIAKKIATL